MVNKLNVGVIGLKGLPAFGGAATVGENTIRVLKDKYNFTVYAVSSHAGADYKPDGFEQIVFKRSMGKLNVLMYYIKSVTHALFKGNYDLIHLHHTDAAFIIPLLRLKYKVVCTSHAQPQVNNKWNGLVKQFFKINEAIALRCSDRLTVVSKSLKALYSQKTSREVVYIPNGVDFNLKPNGKLPYNEKYMLFAAGRIIPLKGLHLLLNAIKELGLKQKLVVIGDLAQTKTYQKEIMDMADGMNVDFIPIIKDKALLMRYVEQCELFVFPSLSENMSMMLLEAISLKTPIVCSDIEANKNIINEDQVLFFKSGSVDDLQDKIAYALAHMDEMNTKANTAYHAVIRQYNWEEIGRSYEKIYLEVMDNVNTNLILAD